jgi:hypothetical protein
MVTFQYLLHRFRKTKLLTPLLYALSCSLQTSQYPTSLVLYCLQVFNVKILVWIDYVSRQYILPRKKWKR